MDEMKRIAELIDEIAEVVNGRFPEASNFSIYADAEKGKYFRFDVTQYGKDKQGNEKHRKLLDVTRFNNGVMQDDMSSKYNSHLRKDVLLEVAG